MKAAKRIRDYLYVLKRDQPNRSRISMIPGAEPLTAQDLEAVLDSRESWRQAARTQTEEMLRDLHLALWPDKPVHLHSFEHMLTTIRNRQAIPDAERAERARLASQLAAAENVVRAQKVLLAEIQDAADQVTGAHLFYRTWTSVPEQIRAVGIALSEARAKLSGGALHEQVRDLQRMLRKQRDAAQELRELRNKLTDLVGVGTGDFTDWSNE